jgi:hypothetical protein
MKPGDQIIVKIGGREILTTIDEHDTQRLPYNPVYKALLESSALDLNILGIAYQTDKISFRNYLEFYLNIGYSVCGFAELSAFEHLEIENPLWDSK